MRPPSVREQRGGDAASCTAAAIMKPPSALQTADRPENTNNIFQKRSGTSVKDRRQWRRRHSQSRDESRRWLTGTFFMLFLAPPALGRRRASQHTTEAEEEKKEEEEVKKFVFVFSSPPSKKLNFYERLKTESFSLGCTSSQARRELKAVCHSATPRTIEAVVEMC